jgi:branched-chain amino acid transport system ATP-binding protein
LRPKGLSNLLETRNLTKSFGGLVAVQKISLTFKQGELSSIIGPNGAGKTTFFNLLTGSFPPTSGQIFFKGEETTQFSPPEIFRRRIVRTFQISSIFPDLSVRKHVEIAAQGRYRNSNGPWGRLTLTRKEIQEKAEAALAMIGLQDLADHQAGLLAYGNKRRLEIAMGLISDPEVFLLDEPTAGMSPEETYRTAQLLRSLAERTTLILVEHDMNVIMGISDRVIVLNRGEVIADGPPREIQAHPKVREVYLGKIKIHAA